MYQNPYYGMNGNNNQPQPYNVFNQGVNNQTISDTCLRTFSTLFSPIVTQEFYSLLNKYKCSIENFDYHNNFNCFLLKLKLYTSNPSVPSVLFNIIMSTKGYSVSYPILSLELPSNVTINSKYNTTFNDACIINQKAFFCEQTLSLSNLFYCIHWYITQNDFFILSQPAYTPNQFVPQQPNAFDDKYKIHSIEVFMNLIKNDTKLSKLFTEYWKEKTINFYESNFTNVVHIGSGATCEAYKATYNGMPICLKVYNSLYHEDIAKSFFREVSETMSLSHEYILKSWGISIYNGKPCLLSRYCEYGSIRFLYSNKCPQECRDHKYDYMMQIVLAIDYMHIKNRCHRDIKYENIFICADGSICIGDLGMTREIKNYLDKLTTTVGTHQFNAPEVKSGSGKYNQKADIYSLGIVLLFIITGIDLATATSIENMTAQTKMQNQEDGFNKIFYEKCRKDFPDKYKEIYNDCSRILLCLQKRPENRPDSGELFNYCLELYKKYSNARTDYYIQMKNYYRQLVGKS